MSRSNAMDDIDVDETEEALDPSVDYEQERLDNIK